MRLDDRRDHGHQSLVEVADIRIVGEQIQQHRPHRLKVLRRQCLRSRRTLRMLVGQYRAIAEGGRPPQVEQGVVGNPVIGPAQHRTRQTFAQHLTVTQAEHRHHPASINSFRGSHRDAVGTQGFNKSDKVAGQAVRSQRLGGPGSAVGHRRCRQFNRSSPAART